MNGSVVTIGNIQLSQANCYESVCTKFIIYPLSNFLLEALLNLSCFLQIMEIKAQVEWAPTMTCSYEMFCVIMKIKIQKMTKRSERKIPYCFYYVSHTKFSVFEKSQKSIVPERAFSPSLMYYVKYFMIKGLLSVRTCTRIFQNMMLRYYHLKAIKTV